MGREESRRRVAQKQKNQRARLFSTNSLLVDLVSFLSSRLLRAGSCCTVSDLHCLSALLRASFTAPHKRGNLILLAENAQATLVRQNHPRSLSKRSTLPSSIPLLPSSPSLSKSAPPPSSLLPYSTLRNGPHSRPPPPPSRLGRPVLPLVPMLFLRQRFDHPSHSPLGPPVRPFSLSLSLLPSPSPVPCPIEEGY